MAPLPQLRRLFRLPASPGGVEREVEEEIRFHLEARIAELRAAGAAEATARARALEEFGDVAAARGELIEIGRRKMRRDRTADRWESLLQDARYAARTLGRAPAFSAVAALTLALGIGMNGAIFGLVDSVMLRPLPFPGLDRLAVVWETSAEHPQMYASPPNYADWRARNRVFSDVAAFAPRDVFLAQGTETLRLRAARATASLFPTLGVAPALGRNFLPAEERPGAEPVAILGWDLWRTRFAGDPGVLGSRVRLEDGEHTVVGVMPPGFRFPPVFDAEGQTYRRDNQLWVPLVHDPAGERMRGARFATVLGRLRPGVTMEAAESEMRAVAAALAREHPEENAGWTARLEPLRGAVVGEVGDALRLLALAVGVVLLIVCVNITNLLLARAAERQPAYAVRAALGASRGRLLQQSLVESQLLALLGGAAGVAVAWLGLRLLVALAPADIPGVAEARIDGRVLAYTFALTALAGLLSGTVPALRSFVGDLGPWLKGAGRTSGSRGDARLRRALVVVQVSLSVLLVVGAALLFRTLLSLRGVDAGIRPERVVTLRASLAPTGYPDRAAVARAYAAMEARVRAVPGVEAAGFTLDLPLAGDFQGTRLEVEGRPARPDENRAVHFTVATPGYFGAMRIPLRDGRLFDARHDADGLPAAIVNETLARRFFPGGSPLGRRITSFGEPREIVGVVGDVRLEDLRADAPPIVYLAHAQQGGYRSLALVARTRGDPAAALGAVRAALRATDPALPLYDERTMEAVLSDAVAQSRFWTGLLVLFSGLALTLAAVGIYGVASYGVSQRVREIGIRMALGASPERAVGLVLSDGFRLVAAGVAAGLVGALAAARLLAGLLYGVQPSDPAVLAGAALFLLLVGLAALYAPARRASRIQPMAALRGD